MARIQFWLLGSYFIYLLPSKSFYLAISSNLSGLPYTKQSSLLNIDMCFGFEKLTIGFLGLSFFNFLANILFLFSILRRNDIKKRNDFNCLKLSVWSLVLYRNIQLKKLFYQFLLFFLLSFIGIFDSKSFFILDFIEIIKNYIKSFLG